MREVFVERQGDYRAWQGGLRSRRSGARWGTRRVTAGDSGLSCGADVTSLAASPFCGREDGVESYSPVASRSARRAVRVTSVVTAIVAARPSTSTAGSVAKFTNYTTYGNDGT